MYIHSSYPFQQLSINSNHQVIAAKVQLTNNTPITIASIYLPGREQITNQSITSIIQQLPNPFLLLGDFNAHHNAWGAAQTNARGRITLKSVLSSDHHPIITSIIASAHNNTETAPRYNYKRADWENYAVDAIWNTLPSINSFNNCASLLSDFYSKLKIAADHHIPQYTPKRFYPKPYWDEECKRLWHERERQYKVYKRTGNIADMINWKKTRALTKKTIRELKKNRTARIPQQNESQNTHVTNISEAQTNERPPTTLHILPKRLQ